MQKQQNKSRLKSTRKVALISTFVVLILVCLAWINASVLYQWLISSTLGIILTYAILGAGVIMVSSWATFGIELWQIHHSSQRSRVATTDYTTYFVLMVVSLTVFLYALLAGLYGMTFSSPSTSLGGHILAVYIAPFFGALFLLTAILLLNRIIHRN